jgi:hypothetical protein
MADNIKISELVELTSGSLSDSTIVPVLDGGTTKKASLSSLQSYLTDDLATDSELSTQIGNVNSTISGLSTTDISEGSNKYYTDTKVDARITNSGAFTNSSDVDLTATTNYISGIKTRLNTENVISSSQQISASAASSGFGAGGGGGASIPSGTVSSSAQTIENLGSSLILSGSIASTDIGDFSTAVSSSAAASGFGNGGAGGGGGTDYISNITLSNSTLTFTGLGSAFNNSINLAAGESDGGNLLTTGDAGNFVGIADYELDSASFASGLGGGGSVPTGTVSSSAQTIKHINTIGVVSSSNQIDGAQIDLSSLTTDDVSEGSLNRYYNNTLVLPYLNQLQVISGSSGGGFSVSGTNIVSSSAQISNLEFVLQTALNASASTLQTNIDLISNDGLSANDVNVFLAKQKFTDDIEITGSILLNQGAFSGSGAQLSNIPASAIIGLSSTTQLIDGDNNITVDNIQGITATIEDGNFNVNLSQGSDLIVSGGHFFAFSGSVFSGSGAGLTGIPGSAIVGGVGGGTSLITGSVTASVDPNLGLIVNSNISASGNIFGESISVGSSGTPTIYSANNLNLSASSAVVVTDSSLRLNPLSDSVTGSLTPQTGDMVFSSDSNDFYGYRIVNQTGSWYSLTSGVADSTEVEWDTVIGVPSGIISSSEQLVGVGNTLLSSSAQFLPSASIGTIYYQDALDEMSGSSDFTYTAGDVRTLNVNKIIANEIVYNTSLSGAGNDTGSYGRVETDALSINSAIEFPIADGTPNEVLKTDGNGNLDFASFADVLGNDNITTAGNVTMGTGSVNTNLTVGGTFNIGSPVHSTFNNQSITIDSNNINVLSSGSLLLSSSIAVTVSDVLILPQRTTNPSNPSDGTMIVSSSGGQLRPYFWDGSAWKGISFTS